MEYPGSLHNHTEYSNLRLRDSINKTSDIITYAAELGHEVFALTDHESTSGWIEAENTYDKLKKDYPNFKLIRGNEIYLCRNGLNNENFQEGDKYYHFLLLAKDLIGAKQIFQLSTRAFMRSYMAKGLRRVPTYYSDLEEIIGANPGHVIGSTACRGSALGTQIMKYRGLTKDEFTADMADNLYNQILNWCTYLEGIFGKGNFFLEFQPSADNEQKYINQKTIEISRELDIPYIITCDSHYKSKDKAAIHAAYLNSQNGDREVASFYATTYLMGTNELQDHLDYLTENELIAAYENILNIKEMCEDFTIKKPLRIPNLKWKIPKLEEVSPQWVSKIPNLQTLINSSFEGDGILARAIVGNIMADEQYQNEETYAEINDNIDILWRSSVKNKANWSAYLLNIQNIIDCCWEANSLVLPARGSGMGFLLLNILGITGINPLREATKTYSWRFLNPDRVSVLN